MWNLKDIVDIETKKALIELSIQDLLNRTDPKQRLRQEAEFFPLTLITATRVSDSFKDQAEIEDIQITDVVGFDNYLKDKEPIMVKLFKKMIGLYDQGFYALAVFVSKEQYELADKILKAMINFTWNVAESYHRGFDGGQFFYESIVPLFLKYNKYIREGQWRLSCK
jgi:hypothetical protein